MRIQKKDGFTLVELLLVILLVVMLSFIVGPILFYGLSTFNTSLYLKNQMDTINEATMNIRLDIETSSIVYPIRYTDEDIFAFEMHEYIRDGSGKISQDASSGGAQYNIKYRYWRFKDIPDSIFGGLYVATSNISPKDINKGQLENLDYTLITTGLKSENSMFIHDTANQTLFMAFVPDEVDFMKGRNRSVGFPIVMEYSLRNKKVEIKSIIE